jgi:phospholipase/lecithinase/hemolysin
MVKWFSQFTLGLLYAGLLALPSQAAFTSIHAYGDGVCTTTSNPSGADSGGPYYLDSYSNGRIWIQVLADRQGLPYVASNNLSYYGHYSSILVTDLASFNAPPDVSTALFIVWVADADFVYDKQNYAVSDTASWNAAMSQSLTNHLSAINTLYNKGVRTLVMPNAVDITEIPKFDALDAPDRSLIRQRIISYNTNFVATLNQAMASMPGLMIHTPDMFKLFDNVLTNAASYTVTNFLSGGYSIDALHDPNLSDYSLNGPGANYIFWDQFDPTAKLHMAAADITQQMLSATQIAKITPVGVSNRLDLINLPIHRNGVVNSSTNATNWSVVQNITSTNASESVFVPASGAKDYYRLSFPFVWTWP